MPAELRWLVEEFEALWEVTGLAELFAARMAGRPADGWAGEALRTCL